MSLMLRVNEPVECGPQLQRTSWSGILKIKKFLFFLPNNYKNSQRTSRMQMKTRLAWGHDTRSNCFKVFNKAQMSELLVWWNFILKLSRPTHIEYSHSRLE